MAAISIDAITSAQKVLFDAYIARLHPWCVKVKDWDEGSGQYREVKYAIDADFMDEALNHKKLEILVVDPARLPAPKLAYLPTQTAQCQCGPLVSLPAPWKSHQCVAISNLEDIMPLNRAELRREWTCGPGKEYDRLIGYYKAVVIPGVDYVPQEYLEMLKTFLTLPHYTQKKFCEQRGKDLSD